MTGSMIFPPRILAEWKGRSRFDFFFFNLEMFLIIRIQSSVANSKVRFLEM